MECHKLDPFLKKKYILVTAIELHNSGDEEVQAKVLADFLSRKLTFTVPDGLHVPKEELPAGFLFNHMRCSRRTLYEPREGFTLIISEESTWCSDVRGEQNRETVRTSYRNIPCLMFNIVIRKP